MAAGIGDKFNKVINGTTRPVATTLAAQKLSGAATASVVAATGWDTGSALHGIMYNTDASGNKVAGSQIDWKATLSGTTLSSFTVTAGTDNTYAIGATVELAPTAAWGDDMATGLVVEHNQDGTHAAITPTSVTSAGTVQGATLVATGDIQHRSVSLETIRSHSILDYVASGCVWSGDSYGSTRNASMTAGVVYIGGKRVAVSLVTARSFTASKDTYIDVDNAGTITYTEVANNAVSPALTANNIRLGIIVTAAGSIANVGSVNQGEETKILPIASSIAYSVTDQLGNLIYPRDPGRRTLGYKQGIANATTTATSATLVTGLSAGIVVPAGRKVKITVNSYQIAQVAGTSGNIGIHRGAASGTLTTNLQNTFIPSGSTTGINMTAFDTPGAGTWYYSASFFTNNAANSITVAGATANPSSITVELG